MKALAAKRRHPAALLVLLFLALSITGTAYAAVKPAPKTAATTLAGEELVTKGKQLFSANCATCHGANGEGSGTDGPSLVGVGAAAVDFQVGTGRMPLAEPGVQAPRATPKFEQPDIDAMAAYVASLGPGPDVPDQQYLSGEGADLGKGGEIYRVNCAMCHNFAGAGGALTRGKYAPTLMGVQEKHIYEAMITGPQSMPVFNDSNITPEQKRDVIAYLKNLEGQASPGAGLNSIGPAGDGLIIWTIGIGLMIAAAIWLGRKAA